MTTNNCWVSVHMTGLLIFRAVAELRISSKSAKSREIHENTRNSAKFARNLPKYMSAQHIWRLSWLLGLLLAVNLLIYLETSSLQRENNIPKLPGLLRLMLWKTGKQPRCKKLCHWCISRTRHCCEKSKLCSLLKITSWLEVKSFIILQKHCDYRLEKQTIMLRSVPQMFVKKKWRIVVKRISIKMRQTTYNWIKKILDDATWMVNVFLISWFFYWIFIMFNKLTC